MTAWAVHVSLSILDGKDHRPCCREHRVSEHCLPFCVGDTEVNDFTSLLCVGYTERYLACFREGYGRLTQLQLSVLMASSTAGVGHFVAFIVSDLVIFCRKVCMVALVNYVARLNVFVVVFMGTWLWLAGSTAQSSTFSATFLPLFFSFCAIV